MRERICFAVVTSLLLCNAPAFAKGKQSADAAVAASKESREREARKACLEGDYTKGVAVLSDLFLDFKNPNYIFNQGRCYEQNEHLDEAISRFREYLRTGSEDIPAAQKHIAECEALLKKSRPPTAAQVTPSVAQPAPMPSAPEAQPEPVGAVQEAPQAPLPAAGSQLRIAVIIIAGIGVGAGVAGAVLNVKANSLAKSIEPPNTYNRGTESTRKTYETASWVSYGVAAAGVATGAILYGIGWSRGRSSDNLALVPAVGPGLAGAALKGAF